MKDKNPTEHKQLSLRKTTVDELLKAKLAWQHRQEETITWDNFLLRAVREMREKDG